MERASTSGNSLDPSLPQADCVILSFMIHRDACRRIRTVAVWAILLLTGAVHAKTGALPSDANPQVNDVLAALKRIAQTPRQVPCQTGPFTVPAGGHLQGIQQATITGKPHIILSGSAKESYLALIALDTAQARVARIVPLLPRPFKHAGGFQVCGGYLAIGIEDDNTKETSKIWILSLSQLVNTARPKPVVEIVRRGPYKRATAGAVALARVRDRHLLCVGTWDCDTIDIYRSNGRSLEDPTCGFVLHETWVAKTADRSSWSDPDFAAYQNLNLVVDTENRVYLIAFARTSGDDVADVFALDLSLPPERRLQKLDRFAFDTQNTSFRHGSGLTITDPNTLTILACGYQAFTLEHFTPR
ncbi:MAG: hypothetical protein ACYTAS_00755 [Planctomycetota bacterium]